METVIEKRHKKFRTRIKAHFAAKRAKAKAASAPKATPKASPASTAGKTMSYFKGKSTVIDLGHKPSKAAITGAVAKLRKAVVATAPKAKVNTASTAPKVKAPAAAKADPSNTTSTTLGRKAVLAAVGVSAAATATAVLASSVRKLPKSTPTIKIPTGNVEAKTATLKLHMTGLAERHDARRAKQGTALKHAFEGAERADFRKASDLSARHGARRAKQGTALRHAFEGAKRADARAAAPKPTVHEAAVAKEALKESGGKSSDWFKVRETKKAVTGSAVGKQRNEAKKATAAAGRAARAVEATGTGYYTVEGLDKVDKNVEERRAAERRKGEATRRAANRPKAGAVDVRTTPGRVPSKQKSNRRKAGSDPRTGTDAPKAPTKAQIQTEIDTTKGQVTRLRGVQGTEMGAAPKLTGFARDARIAELETKTGKAAPSGLTQTERDARIASIEKQLKPPKVTKPQAYQQYKELKLEAPKTVSESQKKAADKKYYRGRDARIAESLNPTQPGNVPAKVQATAADQASKDVVRSREITKRIAELEILTAPKGAQQHTPQLKSFGDKANAAKRAGISEAALKRVAVKVPTVKPPVSTTVQPKNKQAAKPVTQQSRGLPTRSAGFESGTVPAQENIGELVKEIRSQTAPPANMKDALGRGVADKIHKQGVADVKRGAELDKQIKALEAQVKTETSNEAKRAEAAKTPGAKKGPFHVGEQLPRSQPKTKVAPSISDMKLEQSTASTAPPKAPPKLHAPVETPVERDIVSNMKRYEQRLATEKPSKPLKSSAIGIHAKTGVKIGKTLGVAALAFSALGAVEASAKEHDPKKRVAAGVKQFKADVPHVAKGIAGFTLADLAVSKVIPAAIGKLTGSGLARVATAGLGRLGLAGYIASKSIPYAIRESKKLASAIGEAQFDKGEAARQKKISEKKYGTVKAATKTRHAKEAYKKAQAKNKGKDLLTG